MSNDAERKFFEALRNIFVGAEIEGKSGYINLMRVKSRYYQEGVFPALREEINHALAPFPHFRQELFDKLHSFFKRYFSESGSIYFRFTPPHEHVYEKVYTDDRDVALFWKTHMLYYVKTDRIFRSMEVEVAGFRFIFDVAALEHKKANEKRSLVFAFRESTPAADLVFEVQYSERGSKTNLGNIRKTIKEALGLERYTGQVPPEETLEQAFRLFERQSEVDYFINKDARKFLQEQFHLWLYQYVFSIENESQSVWTERRIRQIQVLQAIAHKIIDFIAQFEDELVRIWNKPKFVLNSHYVLTLDRLFNVIASAAKQSSPPEAQPQEELWPRLLAHPGFAAQVQEWQDLGMIGADFTPDWITQKDLLDYPLHPRYQYLPLDTRHFPDLEAEIIARFDHLDQELDGWLIHSENYQALNTLLLKFKERVQSIYIDPPYNSPSSEIIYQNRYKHSSWLSLMENRIAKSKTYLQSDGVYTVAIDDHEMPNLSILAQNLFTDYDLTPVTVVHNPRGNITNNFSKVHEYALFLTPRGTSAIERTSQGSTTPRRMRRWGQYSKREDRRTMFYPIYVKDGKIIRVGKVPDDKYHPPSKNIRLENGEIEVWPIDNNGIERRWNFSLNSITNNLYRIIALPDGDAIDLFVSAELSTPKTVWSDSQYDAGVYGSSILNQMLENDFDFPKSIQTVFTCVEIVCRNNLDAIIFDFFAGSGTTAHAVMNLNREDAGKRKYILVEMGEHFNTVILPRIKKVAFSDQWKDGKAVTPPSQGGAGGGSGISHFVKYYALEQYEDTLRRASYRDADLFNNPQADPYHTYVFLRDTKMLDNAQTGEAVLEVGEDEQVRVFPQRLYPNLDLAETLACLRGKWIRRITPETVEFEDGEILDLRNPDWQAIKPLIWW